jgi:hypothetical protein
MAMPIRSLYIATNPRVKAAVVEKSEKIVADRPGNAKTRASLGEGVFQARV